MRVYPTLHLDTNQGKETTCFKKGYGCKWTQYSIQHCTWTNIKVKEQLEVRKGYGCKFKWTREAIQHYT